MNKKSALAGCAEGIEKILDLLFVNEPLAFIIAAYIYYFGFSQDEIMYYINKNAHLPVSDALGNELNLSDYPRLSNLVSNFSFDLCIVSRNYFYRILTRYAAVCNVDNVCALSLRKTWAYNEACKGTDFSAIKRQLSYKGSISQFFKYLDISYDDILANKNLKILYFKGVLSTIESKITAGDLADAELEILHNLIQ